MKYKYSGLSIHLDLDEIYQQGRYTKFEEIDILLGETPIGEASWNIDYEEKILDWEEFYPYSYAKNPEDIKRRINYIGTISHFMILDYTLSEILEYDPQNILEWKSFHAWNETSPARKKHLTEIIYKQFGIENIESTSPSNLEAITLLDEYEAVYQYLTKRNINVNKLDTILKPEYVVNVLYARLVGG